MRTLSKFFLVVFVMSFVFFTGCKESDDGSLVDPNFKALTDYMAANSMDLSDMLSSWIVDPPALADVANFVGSYYIIDLRSATDYTASHIEGAVNSTLGNILTTAQNAGDKPILVVCYTGQSAGHGVIALRLSGYDDAKVLKWGMSGWAAEFAEDWWEDKVGSDAVDNPNWIKPPALTSNTTFGTPVISTSETDPAMILEERITTMLNGGFKGIGGMNVVDSPNGYFINNFWDMTDVDHYGHISTALRIKPLGLSNVQTLNPSKPLVTYCWTGQTSSMVTAYMTVLGYNAKSLTYGTNGLIYSELESHKFVTPTVDRPTVQ